MTNSENSGKSVLVVDDDDTLREAIAFDFQRRGYRVFTAENGTKAFKIVKDEAVDVVITDIRMPNGNGIELLDWVKDHNVRVPVIVFITGFTDLTLEDAYDKGACVVMSKPFDRKALIGVVASSLRSHEEKLNSPPADGRLSRTISSKEVTIGQGGMFIPSNEVPNPGQTVSFEIEHPMASVPLLKGYGVVRWVRPDAKAGLAKGAGIEFVFLDESCRKGVIDFLVALTTKAFIPKA